MKIYIIEKDGNPIMAGAKKIREFKSYKTVTAFITNLIRVSNSLTRKNFEVIDLSV
jgi:hypothetical protein